LFGDGLGGDVAAVAVGVDAGDGFLVELGEEDVGDGVMDGFGCGLEEVGEANVEAAFAEADGGVEGGEAAEADVERGDGGAGAEFAVFVLEDGDEGGGCGGFFCARLFGSGIRYGLLQYGRRELVEESRGRCGLRRKELQELTQRGGAGMLRCSQGLVLGATLMSLLDQTPPLVIINFYF
jgi:hypothetical protein